MEAKRSSGHAWRVNRVGKKAAQGERQAQSSPSKPKKARATKAVRLLLDTSVLIDVLRGRNARKELLVELVRAGHTLSTTSLNIAEVYAGMRPHEESATEALLDELECHELTGRAGRLAGKFISEWKKKGRTLELPATVVAAVSIETKCALVTDNRKGFPMPEIQLYQLP